MNTSLEAYKLNEQVRDTQVYSVFNCLWAQYSAGYPITVDQISRFTAIKVTTVHARINDLRASGYLHDGIVYKPVEAGTVKNGKLRYNLYTLAKASEVDLMELRRELQRIETKLRRNFAKRKRIRQRLIDLANKPNLFNETIG